MQFGVSIPTERVDAGEEFISAAGIAEVACAAEDAGFHSCYVTDHPFPVQRWIEGGGHHSLDPFVALSFAAAATTTIRLQTHILVLGYRNPFLAAKAALSLDLLSAGRLTLGVGAGYLRGEFQALGADFDQRGAVADETLVAMKRAFGEDDIAMQGLHFEARGNTMRPRPTQRPHPPIWVGGNSRPAIRRAIEHGDGWLPFPNTAAMAPFTRTAAIESNQDLEQRIHYARSHAAKVGRTAPLAIGYSLDGLGQAERPAAAVLEEVAALAALGVSWVGVGFPATDRAGYCEALQRFGEEVIRPTQ
ncbi:MAG: TIGR03619 family F420-dependent LLM class oxidoreductase [Deltaproteobacteria bacterium]